MFRKIKIKFVTKLGSRIKKYWPWKFLNFFISKVSNKKSLELQKRFRFLCELIVQSQDEILYNSKKFDPKVGKRIWIMFRFNQENLQTQSKALSKTFFIKLRNSFSFDSLCCSDWKTIKKIQIKKYGGALENLKK